MRRNKGFTLIELLVVIAVIGLLSSVVMASLNSARDKGKVAAVQSNLTQLMSSVELAFGDSGDYSTVCGNATVTRHIDAAKAAAGVTTATVVDDGTAQTTTTAVCRDQTISWAVSVPVKNATADYFCVDSAGRKIRTATALPDAQFQCLP